MIGRPPPSHSDDVNHARFVELRTTDDEAARAELRAEIIRAHIPLARHLARRFSNRGVAFEDLLQVASIGLVQAVDRFDPDRGVTFATFATPTILGEIKRHFRDRTWGLRVPRRMQELHVALNTVIGELTQQLGRSPTVPELAAATRAADEEVIEAIEAGRAYHVGSIDSPGGTRGARAVERALLADDQHFEGTIDRLLVEKLLEDLPPREQLIMRLRFWDRLTQSDIAQRLGISQMHVSRLLARSLEALHDKLDEPPAR